MSELGVALAAIALIIFIVIGLPIAFAFAAAGMIIAAATGRDLSLIVPTAFWQSGGFALLALPLFIIAGTVMRDAQISDRLIAVIERVTGRGKSSLGTVTVVSCMVFGAISGSGAAAIAAIGSVMIPRMREAGYQHGYATALVACSSVLALLIPPSIPMIVFALTAGISVSAAFLSTVGPGLVIGALYIVLNRQTVAGFADMSTVSARVSETGLAKTLWRSGPALFMPVLMLGGIYSGAFTPTEAAAVALVYAIVVGLLVYRTLTFRALGAAFVESGAVCASVIAILFFLLIFGQLLSMEGIPGRIASFMVSLTDNYYVLLLLINLTLLVLGMFIDDVSGSILAAVVLMPVATHIGVDPIHFAAIVGTNLGMGNVTPPCAPLLFVASSVGRIELRDFVRPAMRFVLLGHLPVVLLVTYVPALAMVLPNLVMGETY
jgi:tripartite ATP-independent transporter DctM subunit